MSTQQVASTCADCFHNKENHHSGVCSGTINCMCPKYVEPFLFEFAQRVEQEKLARKSINKRVKWLLEELPTTRNAGEKTFYKIFIELWFGVKIRKHTGITLTKDVWDRIPNQDTVSREHRRVAHDYPELASYEKEVIWQKTAIFQALLEMSAE